MGKSDDQSDGGGYWMQFFMPSKWTLETLPTPTDPNVKLKPIPERFVAAKFFSGRANDAMVKSKEAALLECLARDGALQRSVHSRLSENERGVGPDRGAQGVKMQAGARSGRRTRCTARTRRNPYPLNIT